jgi:predicted Ser/Thr protein kinase
VSHQVLWVRWLAGRRALDREERAYRRLAGVRGVPALLERPDRDSLLCERIEGRRLDQHSRRSLDPDVFESLERIVRQVHERGVAHGDLHRRDVIVDTAGFPWVLDWATGMFCSGRAGRLRRVLFRRWMEVDRRAVEKLRRRYSAADMRGADALPPSWGPHRWMWRLRRLLGMRRPSAPRRRDGGREQ